MENKIKDARYDGKMPEDTDDEAFTTDFEGDGISPLDTEIYRKYRLIQLEKQEAQKDIDARLKKMKAAVESWQIHERGSDKAMEEFDELQQKYFSMKFANKAISEEIENHLAGIRVRGAAEKMQMTDILTDHMGGHDPVLGAKSGFEPFSYNDHLAKDDLRVPLELRKQLATNMPEFQNLYNPVTDEDSRQRYVDETEFKMRLFEAKWKWYKDRTLG